MIGLFNILNRHERQRLRALAAGELRDVTQEARNHGFTETVCLSRRLWTALIRPYPFAGPNDCVSISTLLQALKQHLQDRRFPGFSILDFTPTPDWLPRHCYLRVVANASPGCCGSIIVRPFAEEFPRSRQYREDALPGTLLVRLGETLRTMTLFSPTVQCGLIASMQRGVSQLIASHPFNAEILAHLAAFVPDPFLPIPLEDYRSVLFADLDELLAILRHCAAHREKPQAEALTSQFRALISPLARFCQFLEELLRFSAIDSHAPSPITDSAFSLALQLYADLVARLQRFETQVPHESLAVARLQIRLLRQVVANADCQFLADMEHVCISLIDEASPCGTHGYSRPPLHAVTWH